MTRTFLLAVDISPSDDLNATADDILESLTLDGIPATSCRPWASEMTEPAISALDIGFPLP